MLIGGPYGPVLHVTQQIGHSAGGRPIMATESGAPQAPTRVLVVGCIHGNECAGIAVVRRLRQMRPPRTMDLWLVPTLNPDGRAADRRQNGHGVDLNRNFSAGWAASGVPGSTYYSGPRPFSEPETRAARRLIERVRPDALGLVPPAPAAGVGVGRQHRRRASLRPPGGAAPVPQPQPGRHRVAVAEPALPQRRLLRRRAARRADVGRGGDAARVGHPGAPAR